MKNTIIMFGLLAFIMLGTTTTTLASEQFNVYINLSDTCSPGNYQGYYCVDLYLTFYGQHVCEATLCDVKAGKKCYTFTCDFAPTSPLQGYSVALKLAGRSDGSNCTTTSGTPSGIDYYWDQISDLNNCYESLAITL